jgi:hypothetical protein
MRQFPYFRALPAGLSPVHGRGMGGEMSAALLQAAMFRSARCTMVRVIGSIPVTVAADGHCRSPTAQRRSPSETHSIRIASCCTPSRSSIYTAATSSGTSYCCGWSTATARSSHRVDSRHAREPTEPTRRQSHRHPRPRVRAKDDRRRRRDRIETGTTQRLRRRLRTRLADRPPNTDPQSPPRR